MGTAISILAAAVKYLADNRDEVGRYIATIIKGVTSIKRIENRTNKTLTIRKVDKKPFEPGTQEMRVDPGQIVDGAFWVPWADNQAQYNDHHMTIAVEGADFAWVWQSGPVLHFSGTPGFLADAPQIPGVGDAGGDRTLVVFTTEDGHPAFFFAGMPN